MYDSYYGISYVHVTFTYSTPFIHSNYLGPWRINNVDQILRIRTKFNIVCVLRSVESGDAYFTQITEKNPAKPQPEAAASEPEKKMWPQTLATPWLCAFNSRISENEILFFNPCN